MREAIEAGEFDELPGAGKPLPGAGVPDDDLWWVREWLNRNQARPDRR
ncbi:MAG: DnaJ family domain-containing protein [Acidimicrobiia bacterium]